MQDLGAVGAAFVEPQEFWSSPLYRTLSEVVASDPFLIDVAATARPGQGPTFAFFGAIHFLLLGGAEHRLANYFASIRGDDSRAPDESAGAALTDFVHAYEEPIRRLLRTRLVQTNHVQRALGLRLGLAAVADDIGGRPAHLLEIGTSAGLVLRQDRYGYRLGDRPTGDRASPLQLEAQWRGPEPPPDLDRVPVLASVAGIDLNPLDPADADDRRWLEALVWPEDRGKAKLLHQALEMAAAVPVPVIAGDAVDTVPEWSSSRLDDGPRVVFHCATRMHVPADRRAAFDGAIRSVGRDGPLFEIAIEGDGLAITGPDGRTRTPYDVDGHLAWAEPRR